MRKRLDFGTGTFGDMGCHIYDPVFKALALTAPLSIRSDGPLPNDQSWATDAIIDYIFPGTAFTEGKTVRVVWYDGDQRLPKEIQDAEKFVKGEKGKGMPDQGSIFLGTKGVMILPHVSQPRLVGKEVEGESHWNQFIETVLGNRPNTDANWDYSGPLTEAVLLGSVATCFPKQMLAWDAAAVKLTNVAKANALLKCALADGVCTRGDCADGGGAREAVGAISRGDLAGDHFRDQAAPRGMAYATTACAPHPSSTW